MNKELVNKIMGETDKEILEFLEQQRELKEQMLKDIEAADAVYVTMQKLAEDELEEEFVVTIEEPHCFIDNNKFSISSLDEITASIQINLDKVISIVREDYFEDDLWKYILDFAHSRTVEITNNILD